ncbi:glycoside hydrolase family 16 protein [Robertkochia marina]|uniref:Glycoside hydrolase family 16 protein n=1 Tax=Robertkochia marina TaxID=1227945 RepID=A0A4V3UYH4_9FLAO|nr:glycoside hydrolase family 16 protein [Robertkochia marina]THD69718.1 glycoside hydrolase family 16 protein [Robertkochia marina]TRZ46939.1 glycoside hydrolase family 16 protein [Robertkochia marina]
MRYLPFILLFSFYLSSCQNEELMLTEEFEGTTLNPELWNIVTGDGCPTICGWGNNERQTYTDNNHRLEDGKLIITARKEDTLYTSTRINTKGKFEIQYGTVEIRADIPPGKGLWPAFWMLGSNIDQVGWPACGEIDIMEYVGRNPGEIFTTLHTTATHGDNASSKTTPFENIEKGFHDYKMSWTSEAIRFYVDNTPVYTYAPEVKNKDTWPFDQPFYLLINLAVGGTFAGQEIDPHSLPAEYKIEHIKVWKNTP